MTTNDHERPRATTSDPERPRATPSDPERPRAAPSGPERPAPRCAREVYPCTDGQSVYGWAVSARVVAPIQSGPVRSVRSDRPSVRPSVRPPSVRRPSAVRPTVRPSERPSGRPSVRPIFSNFFKVLKLSFDALDRLYRPECGGFLGAVSNNSFKKG